MSREPLRSFKVGLGTGKTAKELRLDNMVVRVGLPELEEQLKLDPSSKPNEFVNRGIYGDGLYFWKGTESKHNIINIPARLAPDAREGTDFYINVGDSYIVLKNKEAVRIDWTPELIQTMQDYKAGKLVVADGRWLVKPSTGSVEDNIWRIIRGIRTIAHGGDLVATNLQKLDNLTQNIQALAIHQYLDTEAGIKALDADPRIQSTFAVIRNNLELYLSKANPGFISKDAHGAIYLNTYLVGNDEPRKTMITPRMAEIFQKTEMAIDMRDVVRLPVSRADLLKRVEMKAVAQNGEEAQFFSHVNSIKESIEKAKSSSEVLSEIKKLDVIIRELAGDTPEGIKKLQATKEVQAAYLAAVGQIVNEKSSNASKLFAIHDLNKYVTISPENVPSGYDILTKEGKLNITSLAQGMKRHEGFGKKLLNCLEYMAGFLKF